MYLPVSERSSTESTFSFIVVLVTGVFLCNENLTVFCCPVVRRSVAETDNPVGYVGCTSVEKCGDDGACDCSAFVRLIDSVEDGSLDRDDNGIFVDVCSDKLMSSSIDLAGVI